MVRYCKRQDCGHEEAEHHVTGFVGQLKPGTGCAAMIPGPNVMLHCACREFVAEGSTTYHACTCEHPPSMHDHKVGCTGDNCGCVWLGQHAKPPSIPPLRVVSDAVLRDLSDPVQRDLSDRILQDKVADFEREAAKQSAPLPGSSLALARDRVEKQARERRTAMAPSQTERAQEHAIVDPGAKLFLAGKAREMTELQAAANTIVAETNADDLAAGAFMMRAKIREQATEIVRLRAEFENRDRILDELGRKLAQHKPVEISVRINAHGDAKPEDMAAALREALQKFAPATVNIVNKFL